MANEQGASIAKVAMKAVPFWTAKPKLWFLHMEALFEQSGVTSDTTKFNHVIGALDVTQLEVVEDLLINPPTENKYNRIKEELIKRLSASHEQQIRRLLEQEELGSRSSSQFLRHIRGLAGTSVQDEFLRTLWMSRLPASMRAILATQSSLTLDQLADSANKIHETIGASIQTVAQPASLPVDDLKVALNAIVTRLKRLEARPRSRSTSRRRKPSRSRERSVLGDSNDCWYHQRFGDNARRCRSPYSRRQQGNATDRR
ncbi:hypothetical protein KPH14_012567 [Odynerus spinipes]|uniref:DUF7041 domain-containing protein n=1 Tax=Odynerus spinipes TaxID=1348599 RepID=A0AAD9REY6_9HYME|nr:hypothetical protein KPH14_012567 [Odynerus spinipes]